MKAIYLMIEGGRRILIYPEGGCHVERNEKPLHAADGRRWFCTDDWTEDEINAAIDHATTVLSCLAEKRAGAGNPD